MAVKRMRGFEMADLEDDEEPGPSATMMPIFAQVPPCLAAWGEGCWGAGIVTKDPDPDGRCLPPRSCLSVRSRSWQPSGTPM